MASIADIEAQGWSLNPGRYVGTQVEEFDEEDSFESFTALNAELLQLNEQAQQIEWAIEENFLNILYQGGGMMAALNEVGEVSRGKSRHRPSTPSG